MIDGVENMKECRMGGILEGRPLHEDDAFEAMVERTLGDIVRGDAIVSRKLWSALSNVQWQHATHGNVSYSFRAAGDLVSALIGDGCYLDWYCSGPSGEVAEEIREAFATEGWVPEVLR